MALQSDTQIDLNFEAFQGMLPDLLNKCPGKYALLHDKKVVEFFDSSVTAIIAGIQKFGEGAYSVQEVTAEPENLGFYSYVGGTGQN